MSPFCLYSKCVLVYSKIITKYIFSLSHYLFIESEKVLASFGIVIGNLCSESQNRISEDLKYEKFSGENALYTPYPPKLNCQSRLENTTLGTPLCKNAGYAPL